MVLAILGFVAAALLRNGAERPVISSEAITEETTTTLATTTTIPTTTTEPPLPARFRSELGWSLQPGRGWIANTDDPASDLVIWATPAGSLVSVQIIENEEGFIVTPRSVHEGMAGYLEEAFDVGGEVTTEDAELGGHWAVRGIARDGDEVVLASIGSPQRRTHIVAIHGPNDSVETDRAEFERVIEDFRYG